MNRTVTIAPVRKSIRVNANQAHAFKVFTSGLGRWWPRTHTIGKPPMQTAVLEPRLGGRWYELSEDGSQADVGKVHDAGGRARSPDLSLASQGVRHDHRALRLSTEPARL
jgi:hypothetical protein